MQCGCMRERYVRLLNMRPRKFRTIFGGKVVGQRKEQFVIFIKKVRAAGKLRSELWSTRWTMKKKKKEKAPGPVLSLLPK